MLYFPENKHSVSSQTLVSSCLAMVKVNLSRLMQSLPAVGLFGCVCSSDMQPGLANRHLRVVAVPWRPFLMWKCPRDKSWSVEWETDCPDGEARLYNGILWHLLMFMSQAKNLTYTMMGIDDDWWGGTCYEVNNCTGMVGRVNRKEADFALGLYTCLKTIMKIKQGQITTANSKIF